MFFDKVGYDRYKNKRGNMQTTENQRAGQANHRRVQASTTLSRKYTRRPAMSSDVKVKVKRSSKIQRFNTVQQKQATQQTEVAPMVAHPMQETARAKMQERMQIAEPAEMSKISAKELKDQAIQKALASAEQIETKEEQQMQTQSKKVKTKKVGGKMHFGFGRVMLATACAALAVFAIAYFVNLNMPDISLKVAAMQTGMDPAYPNYVPRDYSISSITSEEGKITMKFVNHSNDDSFTLTEEKSTWDSNALASNYVKDEYGENYTSVREQGLTIYVSGSDAAWVNGGIVYKIKTTSGALTNKQIRSIAVSL